MDSLFKGLIFDYGGTLDSNGQHWASVIQDAYQKSGIYIETPLYQEAYIYAERKMATEPSILSDYAFKRVLELKIATQFEFLENKGTKIDKGKIFLISQLADDLARYYVQKSESFLKALYGSIPMVIVSNFYGNLQAVLRDFNIDQYFDTVIESAVVGLRKPDSGIFQLGIDFLKQPAEQILVVGDSYHKDILPAKRCGCQTMWIKGAVWGDEAGLEDESAADFIVSDFKKASDLITRLTH
ncbi:HAD family hydrolase [Sphingobacterium tabacisoli]|uniref:HAD family hydrolase n=1 Tax=Sphingobacterium tabacisoli TaxID=2044855 RepID=A0ABW5L5K3_9SPHI|nr:HAD family hydrolase [Sphingobacterium tabacisoli]